MSCNNQNSNALDSWKFGGSAVTVRTAFVDIMSLTGIPPVYLILVDGNLKMMADSIVSVPTFLLCVIFTFLSFLGVGVGIFHL